MGTNDESGNSHARYPDPPGVLRRATGFVEPWVSNSEAQSYVQGQPPSISLFHRYTPKGIYFEELGGGDIMEMKKFYFQWH